MSDLLGVLGRCHPLLLHLPIGMIVMLCLIELLGLARRESLPRSVVAPLVGLTALSSVATAVSGWLLSREGYSGELVIDHRNLGIAVAVVSVLFALAHRSERTGAYRLLLLIAAGLLVPAGHLGASMTHGRGFLTEPLEREAPREDPEPAPTPTDDPPPVEPADVAASSSDPEPAAVASTYETAIVPIFAEYCYSCHGPDKQKGKLAMHTRALLEKGGYGGTVLVPGDLEGSELWYRLSRPVDDEDRMPPEGKPQPSAEEVATIAAWIAAGAPFEGEVELDLSAAPALPAAPAAEPEAEELPEAEPLPERPARLAPPDADALAALEAELVHAELADPEVGTLWVDVAAVAAETDDRRAVSLLEPLADHVAQLGLARAKIGTPTLALCSGMPRLSRLDVRATSLGDDQLAFLEGHEGLVELVLAQNELTDAAVDTLLALPALERVFLWQSGIGEAGRARLASERPELDVVDGEQTAALLEEEPEVVFSKPLPEGESAELAPINAACPVSGSPVDLAYRVVYEGRVIGFCCPNCPKTFWDDPAAFAAKLE